MRPALQHSVLDTRFYPIQVIRNQIEDLVVVNTRVRGSEEPGGYIRALASERSHLRIDY